MTLSAYPFESLKDQRYLIDLGPEFEISARFRVLVSRTRGSRDFKSSRETERKNESSFMTRLRSRKWFNEGIWTRKLD